MKTKNRAEVSTIQGNSSGVNHLEQDLPTLSTPSALYTEGGDKETNSNFSQVYFIKREFLIRKALMIYMSN